MHNWKWACKQLKKGKSVRRSGWHPDSHIQSMTMSFISGDATKWRTSCGIHKCLASYKAATDWVRLYPKDNHNYIWAIEQMISGNDVKRGIWSVHYPNTVWRFDHEKGKVIRIDQSLLVMKIRPIRANVYNIDHIKATDWMLA